MCVCNIISCIYIYILKKWYTFDKLDVIFYTYIYQKFQNDTLNPKYSVSIDKPK